MDAMNEVSVEALHDEMEKIAIGLPHILAGGLVGLLLGARLWRGKDKEEQEVAEQNVQNELPTQEGHFQSPGLEERPVFPPRNKINRMHDALRAYSLEPESGEVNPEEDMFGSISDDFGMPY